LVGLRGDGSLDTRFGDQGVVSLMDTFATSEGYALAQDRHGLLYLAGSVGEMGERIGALFRFTANGSLDFAFGENGAMLIGQSPEDDVLYDVVVQRETIRVAGFTTTNGTRHFLLASLQPRIQKAEKRKRFFSYQDVAPIQEIRINGNTRVQIRKMQTWTSALLFQKMELLKSILQEPSAQRRKEHKQRENVFLPLKNWLIPKPAYAATLEDPPPAVGKQNQFEVQILTTDFGGLEAVCYALAIDQYGQLLAVGIAGDADLSTVIATRYVADEVIDEVSDSPGHRSRQIITLPSMDVTQTSLTTGGEISAQFPKEVVRRGVLFSLRSSQSYRSNNNDGAADVLRSGGDFLADIFFPVAVAAESPLPVKQKVSSAQSLEEGITDNGRGTGVFYARLENLFPSSSYSIRAYAMTADGAIYYGDQIYVRTADACFIATASFGSLLHPCVQTLRNFRDAYLMPTVWGQKLVHLYYTISPPVAASIAEHPGLAVVVRILLLPCIAFAWLVLHLGLFPALILAVVIPFVARRLYVAKAAASAA